MSDIAEFFGRLRGKLESVIDVVLKFPEQIMDLRKRLEGSRNNIRSYITDSGSYKPEDIYKGLEVEQDELVMISMLSVQGIQVCTDFYNDFRDNWLPEMTKFRTILEQASIKATEEQRTVVMNQITEMNSLTGSFTKMLNRLKLSMSELSGIDSAAASIRQNIEVLFRESAEEEDDNDGNGEGNEEEEGGQEEENEQIEEGNQETATTSGSTTRGTAEEMETHNEEKNEEARQALNGEINCAEPAEEDSGEESLSDEKTDEQEGERAEEKEVKERLAETERTAEDSDDESNKETMSTKETRCVEGKTDSAMTTSTEHSSSEELEVVTSQTKRSDMPKGKTQKDSTREEGNEDDDTTSDGSSINHNEQSYTRDTQNFSMKEKEEEPIDFIVEDIERIYEEKIGKVSATAQAKVQEIVNEELKKELKETLTELHRTYERIEKQSEVLEELNKKNEELYKRKTDVTRLENKLNMINEQNKRKEMMLEAVATLKQDNDRLTKTVMALRKEAEQKVVCERENEVLRRKLEDLSETVETKGEAMKGLEAKAAAASTFRNLVPTLISLVNSLLTIGVSSSERLRLVQGIINSKTVPSDLNLSASLGGAMGMSMGVGATPSIHLSPAFDEKRSSPLRRAVPNETLTRSCLNIDRIDIEDRDSVTRFAEKVQGWVRDVYDAIDEEEK